MIQDENSPGKFGFANANTQVCKKKKERETFFLVLNDLKPLISSEFLYILNIKLALMVKGSGD